MDSKCYSCRLALTVLGALFAIPALARPEGSVLMTPLLVAFLCPVTAGDATAGERKSAVVRDIHVQMPKAHQSIAVSPPILVSMGPDPGGKTGATVNSDTTNTGQPNVDSAANRNSSSTRNAAEGAERGTTQSQGTANGSDSSTPSRSSGNPPGDSTGHSQNPPADLNPSAISR
jgi:hypothetical protein